MKSSNNNFEKISKTKSYQAEQDGRKSKHKSWKRIDNKRIVLESV